MASAPGNRPATTARAERVVHRTPGVEEGDDLLRVLTAIAGLPKKCGHELLDLLVTQLVAVGDAEFVPVMPPERESRQQRVRVFGWFRPVEFLVS